MYNDGIRNGHKSQVGWKLDMSKVKSSGIVGINILKNFSRILK